MLSLWCYLFILWTVVAHATEVIHKQVQTIVAGENVTLQCQLAKQHEVVQITWQKEREETEANIATYTKKLGPRILGKFKRNVQMSQSGLTVSAITIHAVTLKDEGCYKCIFNAFPIGSITGRTCLKVYALTEPTLTVRHVMDPDRAEKEVHEISCSVTGRPTPEITWRVTKPLLIKPNSYATQHPNQTVTVVSNFSYVSSKDVWENSIICVIHHPSLNTVQELTLPEMEIKHVHNSGPGSSVTAAICTVVALSLLVLLIFSIRRRLYLVDKEQDLLCWVLPVCPETITCARYSYAEKQVSVKTFPEANLLGR